VKGFTFNPTIIENLKGRSKDGIVRFMVYDDEYHSYVQSFSEKYASMSKAMLIWTIAILVGGALLTWIVLWEVKY
jgi:hypothetical protein